MINGAQRALRLVFEFPQSNSYDNDLSLLVLQWLFCTPTSLDFAPGRRPLLIRPGRDAAGKAVESW